MYRLVSFDSKQVLPGEPNKKGIVVRKEKRRAKFSRFFFEDRVAPVTPSEHRAALEHAAHEDHADHEALEAAGDKSLTH